MSSVASTSVSCTETLQTSQSSALSLIRRSNDSSLAQSSRQRERSNPILGCPTYHGSTWTSFSERDKAYLWANFTISYFIYCGLNLAKRINPNITNLVGEPNVASIAECIDLCSRWNLPNQGHTVGCEALTLDIDNICWLKAGVSYSTLPLVSGDKGLASAVVIPFVAATWVSMDPLQQNSTDYEVYPNISAAR